MTDALVNGRPSDCCLPGDRGLHYGDGLFETIAIVDGIAELLSCHLERLSKDARRLGIAEPDRGLIESEIRSMIPDRGRHVIKLILTRGAGERGYRPSQQASPTRIVTRHDWPPAAREPGPAGADVMVCTTRLPLDPHLAGIKTLNRIHQVLGAGELGPAACHEGLMLDATGDLVCGTMSNVFVVGDGELRTPLLDRCGIAGIIRQQILHAAGELGIPVTIGRVTRQQLHDADEMFVCNSLIGLWPVATLAGRRLSPGKITGVLRRQLFGKILHREK